MFKHGAIHLSPFGHTQKTLVFFRNVPTVNADGEEVTNFWPNAEVVCDVQPSGNRTLTTGKFATMYTQSYTILMAGTPDVQRQDRVFIEGAWCVVEFVNKWVAHTEVDVGALAPVDY